MVARLAMRRYRRGESPDGGAWEALQTDVMRFVAILGLCLTAIFALLQTLPFEQPDPRPRIENPSVLQQQVVAQRAVLLSLAKELERLDDVIAERRRRQRAVLDDLAAAESRLRELRMSQERGLRELGAIEAELEQRRDQLRRVGEVLIARRRSLSEVEGALVTQEGQIRELEMRTRTLAQDMEGSDEAIRLTDPTVPTEASTAGTSDRGPSLRFASDQALLRLVRAGRVGLFAIAGRSVWTLKPQGQRLGFHRAEPPKQFHEMASATVPREISQDFASAAGVFEARRVIWGVTLPHDLDARIGELLEGMPNSSLTIDAEGRVKIDGASGEAGL